MRGDKAGDSQVDSVWSTATFTLPALARAASAGLPVDVRPLLLPCSVRSQYTACPQALRIQFLPNFSHLFAHHQI